MCGGPESFPFQPNDDEDDNNGKIILYKHRYEQNSTLFNSKEFLWLLFLGAYETVPSKCYICPT